jgi:hypothetical protein
MGKDNNGPHNPTYISEMMSYGMKLSYGTKQKNRINPIFCCVLDPTRYTICLKCRTNECLGYFQLPELFAEEVEQLQRRPDPDQQGLSVARVLVELAEDGGPVAGLHQRNQFLLPFFARVRVILHF